MKNVFSILVLLFIFGCKHEPLRKDYVCDTAYSFKGRGTVTTDTLYNKTQQEISQYCRVNRIENDSVSKQIICK